jgi:two-component system cell cycle sensor histidine kinase PleC
MNDTAAENILQGWGEEFRTMDHRRGPGAEVQAAREKLTTSDTGRRHSDLGLMAAYARSRINLLPLDLGMVALALWLAHSAVVPAFLAIWAVAALIGLTVRQFVARRMLGESEKKTPLLQRRARILLTEALNGLIWTSAILPLLQTRQTMPLVALALILRAGVEALANASVPIAVYAALGPAAAGLAVYLASVYPAPEAGPLLALLILAHLFFLGLAHRMRWLLADKLSAQAEQNELIAELERAKANSDVARRRAEEANLTKSRFLATMSHELRTPLTSILGFSEVLAEELYGPHENPAYRQYARDILGSGQHLLTLLNDILDLSRVEAGRYELREQSLSLAGVAAECRHLLSMRAQTKNIALVEAMETGLPPIWADLRAVRQIVLNLLTNAVKYTPEGGVVTIKVGWTSIGGQYISVRDTGPGIPEEEIAVVMACFGRGALAQKNAEEGAGLGLPIVKGFVELHQGELFLKSRPHEGAEVVVAFPPQRVMNALPRYETESHAA